jgi:hypothetical protein
MATRKITIEAPTEEINAVIEMLVAEAGEDPTGLTQDAKDKIGIDTFLRDIRAKTTQAEVNQMNALARAESRAYGVAKNAEREAKRDEVTMTIGASG